MKDKALFYAFETVLNSYENKYKERFQYNHLFQTLLFSRRPDVADLHL
jgi:hypothetical protein